MHEIVVDPEVIEFVRNSGQDWRVSTDCSGPVILPTEMKPAKPSDIRVQAGKSTLFISRIQARYIDRVTMDMMYSPGRSLNCAVYEDL